MKKVNKAFFGFWFRLLGWKIIGRRPDLNKYVIAVAPHTSNWDFAVGYSVKQICNIHPNFLAKDSLFKIPFVGRFLRNIGGEPVDRSKNTNMVDLVVEKFESLESFIMTIAPEGTRSYSPKWRTGFYYIAEKSGVPIVLLGFDYGRKVAEFRKPIYPTGDIEADIELMKDFFRPMKGRNPECGVD
ncbi:MAG: acyltransferase [Cytophagales bacterium]|nr:acyltransferase [Cytophagales bacterium]